MRNYEHRACTGCGVLVSISSRFSSNHHRCLEWSSKDFEAFARMVEPTVAVEPVAIEPTSFQRLGPLFVNGPRRFIYRCGLTNIDNYTSFFDDDVLYDSKEETEAKLKEMERVK